GRHTTRCTRCQRWTAWLQRLSALPFEQLHQAVHAKLRVTAHEQRDLIGQDSPRDQFLSPACTLLCEDTLQPFSSRLSVASPPCAGMWDTPSRATGSGDEVVVTAPVSQVSQVSQVSHASSTA